MSTPTISKSFISVTCPTVNFNCLRSALPTLARRREVPIKLYHTPSVITVIRSVSEAYKLFPRLRFGLVFLRAGRSQSGPR